MPQEAIQQPKSVTESRVPLLSPQLSSYFIAGGVAGAASRTVVSPLERLKIIQYAQNVIWTIRTLTYGQGRYSLAEMRRDSIKECGRALSECGERRVSKGSCVVMASTASVSFHTVRFNLQRCVKCYLISGIPRS